MNKQKLIDEVTELLKGRLVGIEAKLISDVVEEVVMKHANAKPKEDSRQFWRGEPDSEGDYATLMRKLDGSCYLAGVSSNPEGTLCEMDAPRLYAAALAYVRAGMELEGYPDSCCSVPNKKHAARVAMLVSCISFETKLKAEAAKC